MVDNQKVFSIPEEKKLYITRHTSEQKNPSKFHKERQHRVLSEVHRYRIQNKKNKLSAEDEQKPKRVSVNPPSSQILNQNKKDFVMIICNFLGKNISNHLI